jgi:hypothetical protein
MEHCQPKRPGVTTGAGRIWNDQGLARIGGDQPNCVLVAGQTVGCGNKGIDEAKRSRSTAGRSPVHLLGILGPGRLILMLDSH